jgi:hypothetical protein
MKAQNRAALPPLPSPPCSNLTLIGEVARSLRFAPDLLQLADMIVQAVTDGGRRPFNGVHLRIELDAVDWAVAMGGRQAS